MNRTQPNGVGNPVLELFVESIANNLSRSFTTVSQLLDEVAQGVEFNRWSMVAEHHEPQALRRVYAAANPLTKVALAARRAAIASVK